MNEYAESISRLNMQERTPLTSPHEYLHHTPYTKPIKRGTPYSRWDKIMKDGRNSKLPKYSISQRFWINSLDLGKDVYQFDLDKTFTTAVGDRKSIAVRNINLVGPETRNNCIMKSIVSAWTSAAQNLNPTQSYYPNANSFIENTFNTPDDIVN